jgi:hypothetical protein
MDKAPYSAAAVCISTVCAAQMSQQPASTVQLQGSPGVELVNTVRVLAISTPFL